MNPEQEELVTVATADSHPEFLVIRSLLESAGIECASPDDNPYRAKGRDRYHYNAIRIQVPASQAEDAITVLKDAEAHPTATEENG